MTVTSRSATACRDKPWSVSFEDRIGSVRIEGHTATEDSWAKKLRAHRNVSYLVAIVTLCILVECPSLYHWSTTCIKSNIFRPADERRIISVLCSNKARSRIDMACMYTINSSLSVLRFFVKTHLQCRTRRTQSTCKCQESRTQHASERASEQASNQNRTTSRCPERQHG